MCRANGWVGGGWPLKEQESCHVGDSTGVCGQVGGGVVIESETWGLSSFSSTCVAKSGRFRWGKEVFRNEDV